MSPHIAVDAGRELVAGSASPIGDLLLDDHGVAGRATSKPSSRWARSGGRRKAGQMVAARALESDGATPDGRPRKALAKSAGQIPRLVARGVGIRDVLGQDGMARLEEAGAGRKELEEGGQMRCHGLVSPGDGRLEQE
jgi:hypothetical protein